MGILKNYLNKMKIVRVCDSITYILTVEIIAIADHTTVKIRISNNYIRITELSSALGSLFTFFKFTRVI